MAVDKTHQGKDLHTEQDTRPAASDSDRRLGQDLGQSTGGYDLVLTGVVFALVGLWLDKRFGFTPVLTIVMTVIGFTGSVLNIYYRYTREIERVEAETAALRAATTATKRSGGER